MAMTSSASERFLNAFATIEGVLRKRFNLDPGSRFYAMVDAASARDAAIRRYSLDLKEFADLRNAIVHERTDGHPIAEPHEASVQRLEAIQQRLSDPPKLGSMFATKVVRAGVDEPIGRPAGAMLRGSFSQVPVYDGELFAGLLTAETIARWVAAQLADGVGLLEEASVRDVLNFTEDSENHLFLPGRATFFDALEAFDDFTHRGKFLDAILVTESGKPNQRPTAIAASKITRMSA